MRSLTFATLPLYEKIKGKMVDKVNSLFAAYSADSFIAVHHDDAVAAFKTFVQLFG